LAKYRPHRPLRLPEFAGIQIIEPTIVSFRRNQ
jgi:hypothetical protein